MKQVKCYVDLWFAGKSFLFWICKLMQTLHLL